MSWYNVMIIHDCFSNGRYFLLNFSVQWHKDFCEACQACPLYKIYMQMQDTVNDKIATKIIFANATFQLLVYNRPTVLVHDGNI